MTGFSCVNLSDPRFIFPELIHALKTVFMLPVHISNSGSHRVFLCSVEIATSHSWLDKERVTYPAGPRSCRTHPCIPELIRSWDGRPLLRKTKPDETCLGLAAFCFSNFNSSDMRDRVISGEMDEQDESPLRKFESSKMQLE